MVLATIKAGNPIAGFMTRPHRIVELYLYISSAYDEAEDKSAAGKKIRYVGREVSAVVILDADFKSRAFFEAEKCIYVPFYLKSSLLSEWASPSDCSWEAIDILTSKRPLRALYVKTFTMSSTETDGLAKFFREILLIPEMSWKDIIEELKITKRKPIGTVEAVHELYRALETERQQPDVLKEIAQVAKLSSLQTSRNLC
jgi:hypothetical protein